MEWSGVAVLRVEYSAPKQACIVPQVSVACTLLLNIPHHGTLENLLSWQFRHIRYNNVGHRITYSIAGYR